MMSLRKMILWTWVFLSLQPSNISSYFLFNHNEKTQATRSQSTHLLTILDHVLFEVVHHILVPRGNQNGELDWITIWIMACLKSQRKINLPTLLLQNVLIVSHSPNVALIYGHLLTMFFFINNHITLRGLQVESSICLNNNYYCKIKDFIN